MAHKTCTSNKLLNLEKCPRYSKVESHMEISIVLQQVLSKHNVPEKLVACWRVPGQQQLQCNPEGHGLGFQKLWFAAGKPSVAMQTL